jgi:hypothetical protein
MARESTTWTRALARGPAVCHNRALVSRTPDSATPSAHRGALPGDVYAYAYPFAWRFS